NERTITVFVVFDQVYPVRAAIFRHVDGNTVFIGQPVGCVVQRTVFGEQLQTFLELAIEWLALLPAINTKLLKSQILTVQTDFTNGMAGTGGKRMAMDGYHNLLPDAKLPENRSQYIPIDVYVAGDGADMAQGIAQVRGQQVAR